MANTENMEVYDSYSEISSELRGAVVAIGSFDGLHRGHGCKREMMFRQLFRGKTSELN